MQQDRSIQLYSQKEIAALLKRAIELQKRGDAGRSHQLSLAEVQQIAADVGIDPRYIEAAVAEQVAGDGSGERRLFGGPTSHELGRIIETEIGEEEWEEMVQEIRRSYGATGTASRLGSALEWSSPERELIEMHLSVSSRDGRTRMHLVQQHGSAAVIYYLVGVLFSVIGAGVLTGLVHWAPVAEWGLAAGVFSGSIGTMRSLFGRWTRRQQQKLHELMGKLETVVRREDERVDAEE